jgi:hypothetical protein
LTGRSGAASVLLIFDLLVFGLVTFGLAKGTLHGLNRFLDADGIDGYSLAFAGRPRLLGAAAVAFLAGAAFFRI